MTVTNAASALVYLPVAQVVGVLVMGLGLGVQEEAVASKWQAQDAEEKGLVVSHCIACCRRHTVEAEGPPSWLFACFKG